LEASDLHRQSRSSGKPLAREKVLINRSTDCKGVDSGMPFETTVFNANRGRSNSRRQCFKRPKPAGILRFGPSLAQESAMTIQQIQSRRRSHQSGAAPSNTHPCAQRQKHCDPGDPDKTISQFPEA
jgi:hypothetical protein